jgi:Chaperone of endosialidase
MATRATFKRNAFLLAAALMMGQAAQAQWCQNNPAAGAGDVCFGDNSLVATIAGGCCGTASADTAVGFDTLMHNTTGAENTAISSFALYASTTASFNTAVGYTALMGNQTGEGNTAVGAQAMESSQTGADNTALGYLALNVDSSGSENTSTGALSLPNNVTGVENSALGYGALYFNTSGGLNTAVGGSALASLTTGSFNLGLGVDAGRNYSGAESNNVVLANRGIAGESGVIRIGATKTQTKAFIAGIYGATSSSGTWVLVNSSGQLGTTTSSLRFKEQVADMGAASADLMRLRPVTFRYKAPYDDGQGILQYGLIAEEVAAVNPGLVQFGEDGQPLAIRYHFIYAMLLNEVQQQESEIAAQRARIASQQTAIEQLALRLAKLEGH